MIYLARNEKIKSYFQSRRKLNKLATKFVGGQNENEALQTSIDLKNQNVYTSLFFLGEYESDLKVIDKTVKSLSDISEILSVNNLDIHISVDPTQVGLQIDKTRCYKNLKIIADKIKLDKTVQDNLNTRAFLMIDMEDASVCEDTLNYYQRLNQDNLPVAITLQAYMHRTEKDLKNIIENGGIVRLVKGAFVEKKEVALTSKKDIDQTYFRYAEMMLSKEAKLNGFYPIFATHDNKIIDSINKWAQVNNWKKDEYEFEMLFGVRVDYQKELVKQGYKLRLYLPFGKDWWPYAVRRVGENPKNIKYLLQK